jgi:hypothetical protein
MTQHSLFDPPPRPRPAARLDSDAKVQAEKIRSREETIQERFSTFHGENPDVYRELVQLAREARRAGCDQVGIGMLFEVLRWNRLLRTEHTEDEFKLNNTFRSRYARLIAEQETDLREAFELRELRSE